MSSICRNKMCSTPKIDHTFGEVNDTKCISSCSNSSSDSGTRLETVLKSEIEIVPLLTTVFHAQGDNRLILQDLNANKIEVIKNRRNREKDSFYQQSGLGVICQNGSFKTNTNNQKRRVTFSDETKFFSDDNLCLISTQTDSVDKTYSFIRNSVVIWENSLGTSINNSFSIEELTHKKENDCNQNQKDVLNSHVLNILSANTTDVTASTSACHSLSVIRVPAHGVVLPLNGVTKKNTNMYQGREKFTRRQLIQLGAMMVLGFVFVILIILWLFSPALF